MTMTKLNHSEVCEGNPPFLRALSPTSWHQPVSVRSCSDDGDGSMCGGLSSGWRPAVVARPSEMR
jgi:hypothetical protein